MQNLEISIEDLIKTISSILFDEGRIIYSDDEESLPCYPIVVQRDGRYWTQVENCQIGLTTSLKDSIIATCFCYEIFSIEVPSNIVGTINFFL